MLLRRDEFPSPLILLLFSILTFGLYFVYHEFKMLRELNRLVYGEPETMIEVVLAGITYLGCWFLTDLYQQDLINKYIDQNMMTNPSASSLL